VTTNGPIEPAADYRAMAYTVRQMFLALVQEGFSEQQALVIVGSIIAASITST
jgi:hypothetical protein